ncbi:hypothetical protein PanWU01x14_214120 [Parasponia andersonii]|uniref:Uncharacterized protein n=1 Tax=Parasponia andersonii TaxID=3476 RepID=A0A2P5BSD5_PARAD|nr:hypothetical protein PanWU01x14_214120 [Parasponia andersonii]
MLLVPSESKDNDEWNVYSVLENRFLPSKLVFPPYDRPFSGSSEGWILTLDEDSVVTLYKPFAEKNEESIIHLPPLFSEADAQLYADVREFRIKKMTTRHGPWDLGVYDLESGLCTRGFNIDAALIAKMVGRSPIWVLPTF